MTGIIVEIKGKKMVVMSDRGDFKKLKYQEGCQVGQEIELDGLVDLCGTALVQRAIATAALLLIVVGIGLYTYYTPYSYVNLDINPSIGIVLNVYERVLDVQGINREGQMLVEANGEFMHDNVGNTISRLIRQAYDANYLKQDEENEIMITISAPKSRVTEKIRDEVQYYARKELEQTNITSNVAVEGVTIEKHALAKKEHISTGKLLLLEQLQESLSETNVEQVKGKSVKEIKEYIKKEDKNKKQEKTDNTDTPGIKENINKMEFSNNHNDLSGNIKNIKQDKKENIEQKDKKDRDNNKYENKEKVKENNNKINNNNKEADNNGSDESKNKNQNNSNTNINDNKYDNNAGKNKNHTSDKKDEEEKERGKKTDEKDKQKTVEKDKEKSRIQNDVYEPNLKGQKKDDEKEGDTNNKKRNESSMDLIEQQGKD
ncbi:MAG: anti-sigma factor domain-containing protein [Clostridiaceae bacterium]|nr:anti-sigma factor domain-containing protein [Clostridiaceae bacterium]